MERKEELDLIIEGLMMKAVDAHSSYGTIDTEQLRTILELDAERKSLQDEV